MIWLTILDFLQAIFSNQADRDLPEVKAARLEAEREAARERSRKAADR